MNFDQWEYRESVLPKNLEEQETFLQSLREKFLQKLQADEAVQAWLKKFDEKYTSGFLKYYANYKAKIVEYSSQYIRKAEQVPELKHREYTQKTLALILQKKLFNLQCQWRAEQITLPGIRFSFDFWYWAEDIFNCPFLDPVTEAELSVLQRYLQTDEYEPEHLYSTGCGWQYYKEVCRQRVEDEQDEILSWYDYYDLYMGTSALLLLPDIRGQKEEVYYDAARKKEAEERNAALAGKPPHVPKPIKEYLSYSVHRCYELACLHEYDDPHFTELMRADSEEKAHSDALEEEECDAISYFYKLENIPNPPPVRSGLSWRMALKYCYIDYLKAFVADDLPAVCEEYNLYRSMNLFYTLDNSNKEKKKLEDNSSINGFLKQLLRGRALLGEPEDLNF